MILVVLLIWVEERGFPKTSASFVDPFYERLLQPSKDLIRNFV